MFMNLFHLHNYYECDKRLKYYSSTSCPCVMLFSQTSTGLYYVKMYFLIHVINVSTIYCRLLSIKLRYRSCNNKGKTPS